MRWEAVGGSVSIGFATNASNAYFYMTSKEPVVIRAIFDMPTVTVEGGKLLVGGEEIASGSEVPIGTTVTVVADTAPAGQYFYYWSYTGGITPENPDATTTTFVVGESNVTFSTQWRDCGSVSVTDGKLYANGTEIASGSKVTPGTVVTVVANAAPGGKYFYGWSYSGGITLADSYAATTTFTMGSSNASLSINWRTSPTVTVTGGKLYVNDAEVASGTRVAPGTVITIVADAPAAGKYFYGWSGTYASSLADSKATETTFTMGTSNVSFTASLKDCGSASITGGKLYVNGAEIASGTKLAPGTVVTLVADPPADHIFDKWVIVNGTVTFANANAATTTFTMPAGAVSVKATYKEVEKILLTEVNVTLDVPVVGEKPDFTAIIPDSANYSVSITWETSANGWTEMTADSVFENGFFYDVYITVIPSAGYKVDSTTVVKLNGAETYDSGNTRYYSFTLWKTVDGPEIPEDAVEITDQNATPYSYNGNTATYNATNGWTSVIDVDGYYSAVNLVLKAGDLVYYQFLGEPSSDVYLYDFTSDNCTNNYVYGDEAISSLTGALTAPADGTYTFEHWANSSISVKIYVVRAAAGGVTVPSGAEEITDQNASAATEDENNATYDATNGWTGIDTGSYYDLFTLDLKAGDTLYYSINGSTSVVQLRDRNGIAQYCESGDTMPDVGQIVVQIDGTYTFGIDDESSTTAGTTVKVYVVRASGEVHTHGSGTKQIGQGATCTVDGWKDYYRCSCGRYYTEAACTNEIADLAAWKTGDGKIAASHNYGTLISAVAEKHTQTELAAGVAAHYHCSVCDKYFTEGKVETTLEVLTGDIPTHSFGAWINTDDTNHYKSCSCGKQTEVGAHDYTDATDTSCNVCGHDRTVPHTHGSGTKLNGQGATCTVNGWKDYYQCSCGRYYTEAACTNEIADLAAWKTGDGKIAASHNYGNLIAKKDANCTETGMKAHYECSVCHTLFDENQNVKTEAELTIATNDSHSFGAWASNGNGTHTRTCSRNAAHKQTENCAGGTATCTQKANCSTCGGAHGAFGEHQYGTLIPAVAEKHTQTELAAGVAAHYKCSVCQKYFTENKAETTLDALTGETPTHSYGDWITSDPTNHWKVCECGKKDAEGAHGYTDASDMTCNTCGHDRTAPHTHGNGQKVNGQAASCIENGWKDYYQCSCGKIYTDQACTNEITDLVSWKAGDGKIAASHNYGTLIAKKDANCTETGMQAHYECSVCHTLFDENQNVKTEAELTIATNDSHSFGAWASNGNGMHTRTCSRNAAHKQTENCAGGTATCTQKAICSTCSTAYGSLAAHQHSAEWSKNADTHWHECTCGDKKDQADHIPGASATETQPQTCTVCGYVIASATGHVTHVPDNEWASNETHHWHACAGCDEQLDKAVHTDGDQNGKCDACDHTMSSSSDEPVDPNGQGEGLSGGAIAAIAVGSVAVAGIGGFSIFWFVIKKKSFTDLGALLKVGCKKASAIAKRIGERISAVFKKK